ncbi:MAG: sigma-70 family RNA polymerase sigma factor [Clostridiales bacterium]|nr:sigma-70 family RNA polymerase sigma factor [Clostridiales bacterium]
MINIDEQYDKLYRYCFFRLHDREEAEDITQETFLRYFSRDRGLVGEPALCYLYTIARNLCIDRYRRPKSSPLTEELTAEGPDSLEQLALRQAMERLPEEDRELIWLRYVNEIPVHVLCRLYGQSRFAIFRRTQKILKQLREELEGTE